MMSYYAEGYFTQDKMADIVEYGPGDTQNLFFSPLLCQTLSPGTLYSVNYNKSTLYLLNKDPTLSGERNISFQDEFVSRSKKIVQRNLHLHNDSIVSLEACLDNSTYRGVANFYLVKGKQNYEDWYNSGREETPTCVAYLPVRTYCSSSSSSNTRDVLTFKVVEEDQYYLVFVNQHHITPYAATVRVLYNIRRVVWEPDPETILALCSFTTSPCSLDVPLTGSMSVLLDYGEPYNWEGDWENNPILVSCAPRVWLYGVISVTGLLVIALSTVCVCCTCCCCCRFLATREKNESDAPLLGQRTGEMYGTGTRAKEMSDPLGDNGNDPKAVNPNPHIVFRSSNHPHRPPSFESPPPSKFRLGTPTHSTFTNE